MQLRRVGVGGAGRRGAAAPGWAEQSSLGSPGAGASEGPAWTSKNGVSRGGKELGGRAELLHNAQGREQRSEHRTGILGGPQGSQAGGRIGRTRKAGVLGQPGEGLGRGAMGWRGAARVRAGRDQVGVMGETVCSLRDGQPRTGKGSGVVGAGQGRGRRGGWREEEGRLEGRGGGRRAQCRRPRIFRTWEGFQATAWLAPGGPGLPHFWGSHPPPLLKETPLCPLLETWRIFHDWGMSNSTTAFISRVGFYHQPRRKRRKPTAFGKRGQERLSGRSGKGCQKDASLLAVLLVAGTTPRPSLPHPRAHQWLLLPCNLSPPPALGKMTLRRQRAILPWTRASLKLNGNKKWALASP